MATRIYAAVAPRHSAWHIDGMDTYQEWSSFYDTPEWDNVRRYTLKRYGCRCMCCGAEDRVMQVDHIRPHAKYPGLRLDPDNLQVLCAPCNFAKGSRTIDYRPRHITVPPVPAGWPWSPIWRVAMLVAVLAGIFLITLR